MFVCFIFKELKEFYCKDICCCLIVLKGKYFSELINVNSIFNCILSE